MRGFLIIAAILISTWHGAVMAAEARESGLSALRQAIDSNDVKAVAHALDAGADPNTSDAYGVTPLVRAVVRGNQSIVIELLKRGAAPNPPQAASTPLEAALQSVANRRIVCNVPMVKLLLEHGAHANDAFPLSGELPLPRALELGDIRCVNTLLDFGADPNMFSERGKPALQAAVQGASETNQTDVVTRMLALGLDVNGPAGRRGGPLVEAIFRNNVAVVRMLLRSGADPCLAGPRKVNAWDFAQASRVKEIRDLMAEYNCRS